MRYSRLLAWLLLVFVVVAVGAQLLRHALPHGGVKTQGVSRVASAVITTVAGTVAAGGASASSAPSTTRKPSKASSQATTRSSAATSRSTTAPAARGRSAGSAPSHFRTLALGASLPSGGQYERWLNDVDRGRQYGAGDALGCMGRWFAGRWHTAAADQYVARAKDYLARRIWETPNFQ